MKHLLTTSTIVGLIALLPMGCATTPDSDAGRSKLIDDATAALKQAQQTDPSLDLFLRSACGYAVFPDVAKGGAIVGGSYGRGTVYVLGVHIGYADITQATVGLQAGWQALREIVVFESAEDVQRFKAGRLTVAANASAVALKSGAAATTQYTDGVAVFIQPIGGLMVEAAVGGQQFTYQPQ